MMIKTALKALMASRLTSSRSRVPFSTSMVYAPIIEPVMLNFPPARSSRLRRRPDRVHHDELEQVDTVVCPALFTAMKPATALQIPISKKVRKITFSGYPA